ncbi:MAG: cytochrome c [Betaproteobacteria bacterium]
MMKTGIRRILLGPVVAVFCFMSSVSGAADPPAAECQQPRFTGKAPDEYYSRKNPLNAGNTDPRAGERIYAGELEGTNCAVCHGRKGNGKGVLAKDYVPPPRNFQCSGTVNGIPDGQLFWIIRFGSPNTEMPDHPKLTDEQIWQLVLYIRQLAR